MRHTSGLAAVLALGTSILSGCGSGADGRPAPGTTPPTVNISASPSAIAPGQATTLTWTTQNATACTASGGWSGVRGTSGSEQIPAIGSTTTFTLACSGVGGSTTQSATVTVNAPGAGDVIVSGKITFDRVPFRTSPLGLDPGAPIESPARQIVVEAVDAGNGNALAATTTDVNGDYALTVPANVNMFIRARAQMLKSDAAPTWDFSVRNNTNSDALYTLDGSSFNSGAGNSTRNLKAAIGWNGTAYTNRAAAPFAILDTVYQAKQLVLSGDPTAELPGLNLYWSVENRPSAGPLCPDDGDIGTSFYIGEGATDDCTPSRAIPAGIYILGDFASGSGDTDEFDQHVVAHEFGHYFEDQFSRSDSIGGAHGGNDRLDFRVAFGEGWGNAYAAMSLNDPAYRDSQGVASEFGFNLESDHAVAEGWFSEFSVGEILFDLFDSAADGVDSVALGFAPMYAVMVGPQVQTDALTSIFTFASALRSANGASAAGLDALLSGEQIQASDHFGSTENNNGGDDRVLPVYQDIALNTPVSVCSRAVAGSGDNDNKLGNRKFLRLVLNGDRLVTIQAAGSVSGGGTVAATDPDIFVHRRGTLVDAGVEQGATETISQLPLASGTYIIEVFDFDVTGTNSVPRCMQVSVQG